MSLLAGGVWRGVASALFSGVDLLGFSRSASDRFLALADIERRPAAAAVADGGSVAAKAVERRGLLGLAGLLTLLGAGPVELLRLRFREEFSFPEETQHRPVQILCCPLFLLLKRDLLCLSSFSDLCINILS